MDQILDAFDTKDDIKITLGSLFEGFMDENSKELYNKIMTAETTADKIRLLSEYKQKMECKKDVKSETSTEKTEKTDTKLTDTLASFFGGMIDNNMKKDIKINTTKPKQHVDDLVKQRRELNNKLSSLDMSSQKEYYAKLYEIPTEKDMNMKLDMILEKMDDMQSELAILRKQFSSK